MNFFRLLSLLFLALVFAACGGSLNDDSTKAKMDRDNEKTLGEDSTVVGVYQGKLALDSDGRNLPGKVILYVAW
jgi:hypothetical protein